MKNIFFIGLPHHEIHLRFFREVLGGEFFNFPANTYDQHFDGCLERDGSEVIWFFANLYPGLHERLSGKQVYIGHGAGFKRWLNPERVESLGHMTQIWCTSRPMEFLYLDDGIPPGLLRPAGYPMLLDLDREKTQPDTLLISVVQFGDWNEFDELITLMRNLDDRIQGRVTIHPQLVPDRVQLVRRICQERENLSLLSNQDELMKATEECEAMIASSSSVAVPFWFLSKPVILIRGRQGRLDLGGWTKVRRQINHPLFDQILNESTRISRASHFHYELFKNARVSKAAHDMFYPTNRSREETARVIRGFYAEMS